MRPDAPDIDLKFDYPLHRYAQDDQQRVDLSYLLDRSTRHSVMLAL